MGLTLTPGREEPAVPCHDILVRTDIIDPQQEWVDVAQTFWESEVQMLGIQLPFGFRAGVGSSRASYSDYKQELVLMGLFGIPYEQQVLITERYKQAYVAGQIFTALQNDGYDMSASFTTDMEGAWVIEARDISRNATIGVTLYRTLEFEIDFLDAMHDDSVWLSGGEFGRIIEMLKKMGLNVNVEKIDIDEDKRRAISNQLFA